MISTALALDMQDVAGSIARWRQLVDLVVQARGRISPELRETVLGEIERARTGVPVAVRKLAAAQLGARARDADAVALFGMDDPMVAAPVLSVAQLDAEVWLEVIPRIPVASRALLRNRRDLPEAVARALESFGHSDFALPAGEAGAVGSGSQIRELVARIEAFRQGRVAALPETGHEPLPLDHFAFECNADGVFDWVSGAPRESLIGVDISEVAGPEGHGVDGQAAGAFRRRAPFRDARLSVAGSGPASGQWLIGGAPVFNPRDGRFAGYHGSARRPRPHEVARPIARFAGTSLPVDSVRQLVHELRTPLNAIMGFAEMIDQQLLGPAAAVYRTRASEIAQDGRRLLEIVNALDEAARSGQAAPSGPDDAQRTVGSVLRDIDAAFAPALAARGITLAIDVTDDLANADIASDIFERMMTRLVGGVIGLARETETIGVRLTNASGQLHFEVKRPPILKGVPDAELLDPAFNPATPFPDGPLLGLGFTLRLVDSLARDGGGRLAIEEDAFVLKLPIRGERAGLPVGAP